MDEQQHIFIYFKNNTKSHRINEILNTQQDNISHSHLFLVEHHESIRLRVWTQLVEFFFDSFFILTLFTFLCKIRNSRICLIKIVYSIDYSATTNKKYCWRVFDFEIGLDFLFSFSNNIFIEFSTIFTFVMMSPALQTTLNSSSIRKSVEEKN